MQTIFRLPWSTEPSSDEALAEKMFSHTKQRQKPRNDSLLNNIKRKRTDSSDVSPRHAVLAKKVKSDQQQDGAPLPSLLPAHGPDALKFVASACMSRSVTPLAPAPAPTIGSVNVVFKEDRIAPSTPAPTLAVAPAPVVPAAPVSAKTVNIESAAPIVKATPTPMASPESNIDKLRAVIEAHIDLEILQKHNELRLIEQELAKCQISMEQLRRCEQIPYPGTAGPSTSVTRGVGKSLKSPAGYSEPSSPAPWGATDGPYSRHYARWLLPDASFDPVSAHTPSYIGTPMTTRGNRGVRASAFDFAMPVPAARTSRTSTGNRQETGTSAGRDPMIMKRQADGEWVRLRCSVCHRSNFNNIQGFLNHCRIAHHQDYKSHEAAAIACGEVVQVDEATMTAAETPAPTPKAEAPPRIAATPLFTPTFVATPVEQPHVHPLVLQTPVHNPLERVVDLSSTEPPKPTLSSMKNTFKGAFAPHLSSLMQRRGLSTGELSTFIADAKKKVDLSVYDETDSEHDNDGKVKKQNKPQKLKAISQARPQSAKGTGLRHTQFKFPPPQTGIGFPPSAFQRVVPQTPSEEDVEMELSPGTAPGLVSDHDDDFDEVDEAKSANGSHHDVEMEDIEIRDASDEEREEQKRIPVEQRVCRPSTSGVC